MKTNSAAVTSYSERSSKVYDDAQNKSFVYGKITSDFLNRIVFSGAEKNILDIGCGTGFGFEVLREKIEPSNSKCIGIDPAEGMLELAKKKFAGSNQFDFRLGSFEKIPFGDGSIDKIISTLALHWVDDIELAIQEMARVLHPQGSLDILMIARDDGHLFKKSVFEVLKKHLSFQQAMSAAALVQRINHQQLLSILSKEFRNYNVICDNPKQVMHGTFDQHMKWWRARSQSVIREVRDQQVFMQDLEDELGKISTPDGIPFDSSCFIININSR